MKRWTVLWIVGLIASFQLLKGCNKGNSYQECVDAVYRGRSHSYYKERGIADAVSFAVTECMRSDLPPREYARTKVWVDLKTSSVETTSSVEPSWSDWEKKNAIAQRGDFLVIRQPGEHKAGESPCYMQQSYYDDPSKIQFTMMADNKPLLIPSFLQGIESEVTYVVDDRQIQSISSRVYSA